MSRPAFSVTIADLERGPKEITWPLTEAWLRHAFEQTEVTPTGDGELTVELTLNGREVIVQGRARAPVTLPDARNLEPVPLTLEPEIFLLLTPAAEPDTRHRHAARHRKDPHGARKERGHKRNKARQAGGKASSGWEEDPTLTDEDAARDTYSGDRVVLDDFLREFLLLELPMTVTQTDLPGADDPASAPPSGGEDEAERIDPRLAPLAAIASRLRQNKE